ncbi:MAG TPA: ROK family protein [Rubricoccaceae bacterium]|nr:ROK family protein [Rubricoccaceae bacterium]
MAKTLSKALGIDIGGSGVKGAPVNIKKGILLAPRYRLPTPKPATPEAIAGTVAALVAHFEWKGPVGCTVPARVRGGVVETAANIDKSWIGTEVARLFSQATGLPVAVLNDADAAGIAEMRFGAGKGHRGVALLLTFGTGIGSALFRDSRLLPDTEFGHLQLNGRLAEHFASDAVRGAEGLSWEAWARGRVQPYLEHVEFLLDPDLLIIGGGVSRPDRWASFGPLLHTRARLLPAALGNDAGIVGAAYAARALVPRRRKRTKKSGPIPEEKASAAAQKPSKARRKPKAVPERGSSSRKK